MSLSLSLLFHSGEQEFVARTAGISSLIIISSIVPVILIVLIISYRYVKRRNVELEQAEEKLRFVEVENQRRAIYHKMFESHRQKEAEIEKLLNELEGRPQPAVPVIETKSIKANPLGFDMQGESTDDEYFEEPIASSSHSPLYERIKHSPKLENVVVPPPEAAVNIRVPPLQSDF